MKLVEIKEPRVNQIWTLNDYKTLDIITNINYDNIKDTKLYYNVINCNLENFSKGDILDSEFTCELTVTYDNFINKGKLIGYLGITHEFKDNILIEIDRKEFEVNDILSDKYDNLWIIYSIGKFSCHLIKFNTTNISDMITSYSTLKDNFKKIGTLDLTHELINEKLVK